jgi:hypothetical protein
MSAFGGKADMAIAPAKYLLMTQSGHSGKGTGDHGGRGDAVALTPMGWR